MLGFDLIVMFQGPMVLIIFAYVIGISFRSTRKGIDSHVSHDEIEIVLIIAARVATGNNPGAVAAIGVGRVARSPARCILEPGRLVFLHSFSLLTLVFQGQGGSLVILASFLGSRSRHRRIVVKELLNIGWKIGGIDPRATIFIQNRHAIGLHFFDNDVLVSLAVIRRPIPIRAGGNRIRRHEGYWGWCFVVC